MSSNNKASKKHLWFLSRADCGRLQLLRHIEELLTSRHIGIEISRRNSRLPIFESCSDEIFFEKERSVFWLRYTLFIIFMGSHGRMPRDSRLSETAQRSH